MKWHLFDCESGLSGANICNPLPDNNFRLILAKFLEKNITFDESYLNINKITTLTVSNEHYRQASAYSPEVAGEWQG